MVKLICASKEQTDVILEEGGWGNEGDGKYMDMSRCVSALASCILNYYFSKMSSFHSG